MNMLKSLSQKMVIQYSFDSGKDRSFPVSDFCTNIRFFLPHMQVDKGAIKFILSGANVMCPGLTSPGARMTDVQPETVVAIMAEGKQLALGVAVTKMSTTNILEVNKGIALELVHYLNDGLWHMKSVK